MLYVLKKLNNHKINGSQIGEYFTMKWICLFV
jgi:hypothetical protein